MRGRDPRLEIRPHDVPQDPDRQPWRNRVPRHQDGAPPQRAHGRRVLRGRRERTPHAPRRRGGADRPAPGARELPRHRAHHRRRAEDGCGGDPPRLRFPVRERGVRAGVRGCGHRVHRAADRRDPRDGQQERRQVADGEGAGAAGAGVSRRSAGVGLPAPGGRWHRLPGAAEAVRGRRRQGDAHRREVVRVRRRAGLVQAGGDGELRRRPCADRTLRHPAAAYRDPGVRRPPRSLRLPVRARLLGAAAPPEGARGGTGPRHDRDAPARDGRGRSRRRARGALRRRRHGGVHRRPGRPLLLHGDEHAAAGRASGHRDDHRTGPRRVAAARRGRRAAAGHAGAARDPRTLAGGAHLRGGPGPRLPAVDRTARAPRARRRSRCTCASTRASSRATRSRRTTIR